MRENGYTLAETLTALIMVGLAMGGVALGMQVIGRLQLSASDRVADFQARRAAETRLETLFLRHGPYRSQETDRFSGQARSFEFDCGATRHCQAELVGADRKLRLQVTDGAGLVRSMKLAAMGAAHFVYQGAAGSSAVWPPSTPGRQPLRAVSVVAEGDGEPVVVIAVKLWAEQPARCDYDVIMKDCR